MSDTTIDKAMSAVEYEIFYAILQLKSKNFDEVALHDITSEVNRARKKHGQSALSPQHVHYYVKLISKRPFIATNSSGHITRYSLIDGSYKVRQNPPLCLYIKSGEVVAPDKVVTRVSVNICDRAWTCGKTPSSNCAAEEVPATPIIPDTASIVA